MSMDDFWRKVLKIVSGSEQERKEAIDTLELPSTEEWEKQARIIRNEVVDERRKFLSDYTLEQRNTVFFCCTAAVFLFSGGVFRRCKKAMVFSIIGGIFIVPEHFRPYI